MDANGGNPRPLSTGESGDYSPAWFGPAPTRTTVDARPEPARKGARLTVIGSVTKVGVTLPKATVEITFKAKGASQFKTVTSLTTGAEGHHRTTVRATKAGHLEGYRPRHRRHPDLRPPTRSRSATDPPGQPEKQARHGRVLAARRLSPRPQGITFRSLVEG